VTDIDPSFDASKISRRRVLKGAAGVAGALLASDALGVLPGSLARAATARSVNTNVAALGKVTIQHWDYVDSPAWNTLIPGFQKLYPNVTVKHELKTGTELDTQAQFNLSSSDPVDLLQNDGGYVALPLVKAKLWENLDGYAAHWDWLSWYPKSFMRDCRYANDGSKWGTTNGGLYNLPFYVSCTPTTINRKQLAQVGVHQLPQSIDELEAAMAKLKAGGLLPICLGAQTGVGPTLIAQALINHYADPTSLRNFFYGEGGEFVSKPVIQALTRLQSWMKKGYIANNILGIDESDMPTLFAQGKGAIMCVQTSFPTLKPIENEVTVTSFPPLKPGDPARLTGNPGGPGISSHSKALPAAAAWLNYICEPAQDHVWLSNGLIAAAKPPAGLHEKGLLGQALTMLQKVRADDGFITYLAQCSPTAVKTFGSALQDMLFGRATPEQVAQRVAADRNAYLKTLSS
jgi:ABC-type glycerol-3-phosphate transport system substrate-binding protein